MTQEHTATTVLGLYFPLQSHLVFLLFNALEINKCEGEDKVLDCVILLQDRG